MALLACLVLATGLAGRWRAAWMQSALRPASSRAALRLSALDPDLVHSVASSASSIASSACALNSLGSVVAGVDLESLQRTLDSGTTAIRSTLDVVAPIVQQSVTELKPIVQQANLFSEPLSRLFPTCHIAHCAPCTSTEYSTKFSHEQTLNSATPIVQSTVDAAKPELSRAASAAKEGIEAARPYVRQSLESSAGAVSTATNDAASGIIRSVATEDQAKSNTLYLEHKPRPILFRHTPVFFFPMCQG